MSLHKYPKIRRLHDIFIGEEAPGFRDLKGFLDDPTDPLVIQEKIDGANFRFMIPKSGDVVFGSRNNILDEINPAKNFGRAVTFVREKLGKYILDHGAKAFDKKFSRKAFYLEGCWKHSTSYDFDNMPIVIGYDVQDLKTNKWIPYPEVEDIFDELDIPFVPVLYETLAKDLVPFKDEDVPISKYSHNQAEGIMIKNYNKGLFAKFVTAKHKEANRTAFGGGKSPEDVDVGALLETLKPLLDETDYSFLELYLKSINGVNYVIDKFCTNPRIDKFIFKLIDEGAKLEFALMKDLPRLVLQDIFDEEFEGIYHSRKMFIFDFHRLKKRVGQRCKTVLEDIIHQKVHGENERSPEEQVADILMKP